MSDGAQLDLVCGPASPLPETYQRYRLVAHLGSGGQAEVYRGVRLSGAISSAPVTVKVFRIDPRRPLADELRSWDKGDAVLMDLNNRGVPAICRRADGFYGPSPHRAGQPSEPVAAVPYQILDYLHGVNLREYVSQRVCAAPGAPCLNAVATLRTLAGALRALHCPASAGPQSAGAMPVLHMDVKPANIMVLADGGIRLIDFTGARYWRDDEITQISYTPESGGPEAFGGVRLLSPAYDVHGFGAVAYYLVTGAYPRVDAGANGRPATPGEAIPAPWSVLRRHPMLEAAPALRDHLHAPLADRPTDRPSTMELDGWATQLGHLVRRGRLPDVGVDWSEPEAGVHAPNGGPRPGAATLPSPVVPVAPVVAGPAVLPGSAARAGGAPGSGVPSGMMRGRAKVPPPKPAPVAEPPVAPAPTRPPQPRLPRRERMRTLRRGSKLSNAGALFAFVSWGIWAAASHGRLLGPVVAFVTVLVVAVGVFVLARFIGGLLIERRLGRPRRSAKGSHALAGLFLTAAGVAYLKQTPWVVDLLTWMQANLW